MITPRSLGLHNIHCYAQVGLAERKVWREAADRVAISSTPVLLLESTTPEHERIQAKLDARDALRVARLGVLEVERCIEEVSRARRVA